jgi:GNAT superfamily N-acetyltransferase
LVHRSDGYPPYLPGELRAFLVRPEALGAWVAEVDGSIVGHVALHKTTGQEAMELASSLSGRARDGLGVVSRLLVAPAARGQGVGRGLLLTSAEHARSLGLAPMLDVATHFGHAIHLYETNGWTRIGEVSTQISDGSTLDEYVYLSP